MSKDLPIYLINRNIFKELIDYLLVDRKKDCNQIHKRYSAKRFAFYKPEIFNYILVSKKIKESVTFLIENNIVEYGALDDWVSLAKSKNIIDHYELPFIKIPKDTYEKYILKTRVIKCDKGQVIDKNILDLGKEDESQIEFVKVKISFDEDYFKDETNSMFENIIIDELKVCGSNDDDMFEQIKNLMVRNIEYQPNEMYCQDSYYHNKYESLFSELFANHLESIKISTSDFVEPYQMLNISKLTKLHTLSIPMLFHDIIKYFLDENFQPEYENGCDYHYGATEHSVFLNWDAFLVSMSNTKLINLTLKNFCSSKAEECLNENDKANGVINAINKGFQQMFTSMSSLKYLKLYSMDFIDSNVLSGIAENKSIKSLSIVDWISDNNIEYLFKNVLPNSSIKHLQIYYQGSILPLLNKYNPEKNQLYSITIKIYSKIDHYQELVNQLLSENDNIKEFTLKFSDETLLSNIKRTLFNHPNFAEKKKVYNFVKGDPY